MPQRAFSCCHLGFRNCPFPPLDIEPLFSFAVSRFEMDVEKCLLELIILQEFIDIELEFHVLSS